MFDMNVQMREIARITFATVTLALPEKDVKLDVSKIVFLAMSHSSYSTLPINFVELG
jgi:hypothetical protein